MRDIEFMAGYARRIVDKACASMHRGLTRDNVWREYEMGGHVLAYAMRCGIVSEAEGMRLLDRMDSALEAGLNAARSKKSSPTGKSAEIRKNAA